MKRNWVMTVCLAAVILTGNCFDLSIQQDVDYPADLFAARLRTVSALNPRQAADRLSFLVYEGDERQLIRFSLALSTLEMLAESDPEGISPSQWDGRTGKYLDDLRLKDLDRLKEMGTGLIMEVQDLVENTHILVWME